MRRYGNLIITVQSALFEGLLQVATHGGGATVGSQYTPLPESSAGAGDHMGKTLETPALSGVG